MLPLTRGIPWCLHRPPISELFIVYFGMHHQYWFYCERHSGTHLFLPRCWRLLVVDEWWHVEVMRNPMASELFVYMIAVSVCVLLDCFTYLRELNSWLALVDAYKHRFSCYFRQTLYLLMHLYSFRLRIVQQYHTAVVSVAAVFVAHNINIHIIACFENVRVWHAVCNYVVD